MIARLKSSTKWTAFPAEYLDQMKSILEEHFKHPAERGVFIVEGRIYSEELILRVGFLERGRLRQINFETSMEYLFDKDNVIQSINLCFDAITGLFTEYFEKLAELENPAGQKSFDLSLEDEMKLPFTWTQIEFDDRKIHIQYTTVNSILEKEANALLGETTEESLVKSTLDNEFPRDWQESVSPSSAKGAEPDSSDIKAPLKDGRTLVH